MRTPWVVVHDGSDMVCLRCSSRMIPYPGMPADIWVGLAEDFQELHAKCKERV